MDKTISTTLKVVGVLIFLYVIYALRHILLYFIFSFVIALALRPLIDSLEEHKIPRPVSTLFIFLLFFGLIFSVFFFLVPKTVFEIQNFLKFFDSSSPAFQKLLNNIQSILPSLNFQQTLKNSFDNFFSKIFGQLLNTASGAFRFLGGFINFVFVLIISFYFAIEKNISKKFSRILFFENKDAENKFLKGWRRAENIISRWFYSYLILGTIIGIMVYIGLSILGLKYSFLLAILAGVLEILPLFGPIIAGIFGVIFALLQGGFSLALWTALIFVLVQQIENFVIVPYLMKVRIDLHPVLVIVILFVAGKFLGPLGAIVSVPLSAVLIALFKENYLDFFIERKTRGIFDLIKNRI